MARIPRMTRIPATPLGRSMIWLAGVYAVIQGSGMVAGGVDRWSGPSFVVVRQVPGSALTWGAAVALLGLVVVAGSLSRSFHLKAAGLGGLAVWSGAFGAGTLVATMTVPTAATTGGPTYFLIAIALSSLIAVDEGEPSPPVPPIGR